MEKDEAILEEYEINPYTMMIKPVHNESRTYSEVYEVQGKYLVQSKPIEIVKKSCEYFGASYRGRRDGTKELTGATHKAPIIVDPHTSIFMFPTTSPILPQCIWISHEYVVSHKKSELNSTLVTFPNNQSYEIPMSFASFENQLSRTAQLRIKYMQNIKRMEIYQKRFEEEYRRF